MADIPIAVENGQFGPHATLELSSVMLYPKQDAERHSFLALQINSADYMARHEASDSSNIASKILDDAAKNATQGSYAGLIFMNRLQLATYAPEHCSINKAVYLVYREMAEGGKLYNGQDAPSAYKSKVYPSWTAFRRAASLWAAYNIVYKDDHPRTERDTMDERYVGTLLGVSEELLRLSEQYDVAPDDDPWRAAASAPLPPANVGVPGLSDWQRQTLSEYRAPTSPA